MAAFPSPRIKICGITQIEDAAMALALGVDAIGLVFYEASPRAVNFTRAKHIARTAGPFMTVAGLFVNADASTVYEVLEQVPLQVLQFHGEESADFCAQFHRPWIKALRMTPKLNLTSAFHAYRNASGILLDTYKPGVQGGTGEVFDWQLAAQENLPEANDLPIILAGGLNAANVFEAVHAVRPYAVDVSGGVEYQPGIKDPQKMAGFVEAVRCCSKKL